MARARRLARESRYRRERGLVVVDAPRVLDLALDAAAPVEDVFATDASLPVVLRAEQAGAAVHVVDDRLLASIVEASTPQGLAAVVRFGLAGLEGLGPSGPVVVADAVQEPGNVGAIVRTAAAVGAAGVVVLPGSADPTSPRAIRGSAGACFAVPVVAGVPAAEALSALRAGGFTVIGATAEGAALAGIEPPARLALVVGSEAHGLSPAVRAACDMLVALPMTPPVESLNVAVTAGVLLYLLAPPGG